MLTIFDKNGQMRTAIEPSDNSTQTKEVQGENLLNLSFTHYEHIPLDVLDYVDFEGERYWLLEKYAPKQINGQEWSYDLKMYGADSLIKRFLVLETTDGNAEPIFTLTATPREHAQMVLNCINAGMGNSTPWQLGQVDGENLIVIDYNGTYCNEALTQIVEAIGGKTEWWFDAQTLNICRCESGDEITLAYGNGLTELERDTSNIAKFYTRLFPIGSDRNIDPEKYGYFRLMLPGKKKYVEIQTEEYGVFDHFEREAFADIYPRRIGTVSEVRSEDVTDENGTPFTIYYFKDDTLDFDPNQYELPNETKRISFQDGDLAGMGETDDHYFECNYNSDTREFELITIWPYDSDMQLPGGNIIPRAGDHYILWNITMPDEYYTLAEQELQQAVEQYNAEHWFDLSVYKGTTDHVWMEMEGKNLFLGRRVRLENQKYFPETGFRNSRITKITRKVNLPLQMDIEISDAVHAGTLEQLNGSLSQIEEEVESNSKKAEQYRKEAQDFTVRRFRDTQETIHLLEKAMLANFTSSVSPLSVHTMAALVGDESLQFRFIDNSGNTVLCDIAYSNTTHQLTAPKSVLQHLTLGIDTITSDRQSEEYKTWNLEAYTSPAIISETDTNKAFYLYAKVSKTENTGVYLLTDKAVAMEETVGSYHLLIGILNSEYNGERSFVTLYGFTEILPGRITTDKIVSGDGKTYFDLANSEIGGNIKFKSISGEYKGIEEGIAESIDGIETGTRNLILDSLCDKKIPSLATTGGYTTGGLSNMTVEISDEVLYNGKPTLKIQNKPTYYSNQLYIQFDRYNRTDTKLDVADYVFSCMMYVPETYPDRFPFENRVGLFCYNGSTESGNDSYVHVDYDPSKKGTWQKLVAKVPYVKPADGATDWCLFRIRSTNSTTQGTGDPSLCCLYIAEIQLVKGNQAGTWTPAPEDAQAELQAAIEDAEAAANNAQAAINSLNSDNIFSVVEKKSIRVEWESISGVANTTQPADTAGDGTFMKTVNTAAEVMNITGSEDIFKKYDALKTQLNTYKLYTNSDTTLAANFKTIMAGKFADYYDAEVKLMQAVQELYTNKSIDEIEIGGTNICTGSSTLTIGTGRWKKGNWRNSISNGTMENIDIEEPPMQGIKGGIRFTTTGQIGVCQDKDDGLNDGAIVTMSCWVRSNNACTVVLQPYYNSNNSTNVNKSFSVPGNNIWTYLTWSNPRKYAGSGYAGIAYVYIMTANCIVDVCGIKLEQGNKPTAWSPAPEDVEAKVSELDYLKEALQGTTDINGGLLLTTLIQLRNAANAVTAGMSGLDGEGQNVFLWCGGTLDNAIKESVLSLIRRDGSGFFAGGKMKWGTDSSFQVGPFEVTDNSVIIDATGNGDNRIIITDQSMENLKLQQTVLQSFGPSNNTYSKSSLRFSSDSGYANGSLTKTVTLNVNIQINAAGRYRISGIENLLYFYCDADAKISSGVSSYDYRIISNIAVTACTISLKQGTSVKATYTVPSVNLSCQSSARKTASTDHYTTGGKNNSKYVSLDAKELELNAGTLTLGISFTFKMKADIYFDTGWSSYTALPVYANFKANIQQSSIKVVGIDRACVLANDGMAVIANSDSHFYVYNSKSNLDVRMKGLPTSNSGLESGQLYRSGDTLKIMA